MPRGSESALLWLLLWISAGALLLCEGWDAWQRNAPAIVWLFKLAPLLVVVPGALRDHLRSMVWLSFVSLLYFLMAVQRIFAEPHSLRAIVELLAVIVLFLSAMLYVRYRARDLRSAQPAAAD